jgi:hypothetical protein
LRMEHEDAVAALTMDSRNEAKAWARLTTALGDHPPPGNGEIPRRVKEEAPPTLVDRASETGLWGERNPAP